MAGPSETPDRRVCPLGGCRDCPVPGCNPWCSWPAWPDIRACWEATPNRSGAADPWRPDRRFWPSVSAHSGNIDQRRNVVARAPFDHLVSVIIGPECVTEVQVNPGCAGDLPGGLVSDPPPDYLVCFRRMKIVLERLGVTQCH